ncbi:MAG TPA: hypothetical protein K8V15_08625 [Tessaracoccus flavescens]|uniref:Uncharacterized protein n=1 Tax=Tessaracoccus flavescens TaxID=399497 RepID=A0A921JQW4_9ACTN|nr:hypothetical protein [Tessaracoccus flavescens]
MLAALWVWVAPSSAFLIGGLVGLALFLAVVLLSRGTPRDQVVNGTSGVAGQGRLPAGRR